MFAEKFGSVFARGASRCALLRHRWSHAWECKELLREGRQAQAVLEVQDAVHVLVTAGHLCSGAGAHLSVPVPIFLRYVHCLTSVIFVSYNQYSKLALQPSVIISLSLP